MAWEVGRFGQMGDDDAADGVGINQSNVENEGYEVMFKNNRLLVEVEGHENPCYEEGDKASERGEWVLAVLFPGFDDVQYAVYKKYLAKFIMIKILSQQKQGFPTFVQY